MLNPWGLDGLSTGVPWSGSALPQVLSGSSPSPIGVGQSVLAMPFDALRLQYASAVTAGLVPRSSLASGRLERSIDALERRVLGPFARQR